MTNEQMTNDQKASQYSECHSQSWGNNDIILNRLHATIQLALRCTWTALGSHAAVPKGVPGG